MNANQLGVMHQLQSAHKVLEPQFTIKGQKSDAAPLQQSAYCLEADTVPTCANPNKLAFTDSMRSSTLTLLEYKIA